MAEHIRSLRTIRSFVRRDSRITPAQARALAQLWPRYGIPEGPEPLDWPTVFGRRATVVLEIGFGNGEALAAAAAAHPENDYLGIEVHRPGAGSLLRRLEAQELGNVRVMLADASEVLAQRIADASLTAVHLFFPDPWPKKRHHKRRLVQPEFAALVTRKLVTGGFFHLATDWLPYAEHMVAVLSRTEGLVDASGTALIQKLVAERLSTRFEQRGRRLGHEVRDLVYLRKA
ncbi:MAG: tRNA (guanosine(46)-N7)-methyltransferase TrmB [Sulfuricaulis sp.]|uniref:tRNA (guanosine(46)-N7)-methyltransferase TrmB n=1 Tax=Sulfuricaulis sp. TaxID=2003553 RepID=UPI0025FF4902|nr:tRNA (guanosine(46)-N7)-methyltransferase TrmB [Sulfuricaulis sp.]MCR4348097.1 tRNA (guanosine(46)-N7)-methyltransferase TrmB [Sulfuricaulis sp.]